MPIILWSISVEAADDIYCYEIMDIEDSHKLKILSFCRNGRIGY